MTNPRIKVMLLLFLVMSIGADKELMKKECSYANVSKTCLKCLASDPTSPKADSFGLTLIVIHCLESQLGILINCSNVKSLSAGTEKGKKVLEDCNKDLSISNLQLHEAESQVVIDKYDEAINSLKFAVINPLACRDNHGRFIFKELAQIYKQVNLYSQLSSAAMTKIKRLENFI